MSTWRRKAQEQFPQHAAELESWSREGWNIALSDLLAEAVAAGNTDVVKRVVGYVSWCWSQKSSDVQFVFFVEDILQRLLQRSADQSAFCSVVDAASFALILPIYSNFHGKAAAELLEREFRFRPKVSNSLESGAAKPRTLG